MAIENVAWNRRLNHSILIKNGPNQYFPDCKRRSTTPSLFDYDGERISLVLTPEEVRSFDIHLSMYL